MKNIETVFTGFADELAKIAGFGEDVTREGIELAKKLKAKNLVGGLKGPALKDYYHHMDLSAHPAFSGGAKLKVSGMGAAALETAGLGVLARPSVQNLRKPGATKEQKSHAKHEIAGLGILAAHPMYEIGSHLLKKGSAILKLANMAGRASTMLANQGAKVLSHSPLATTSLGASTLRASTAPMHGGNMRGAAEAARKAKVQAVMARNAANPQAARAMGSSMPMPRPQVPTMGQPALR